MKAACEGICIQALDRYLDWDMRLISNALHRVSNGRRKTSGSRDEGSAGPAGPVREGRFALWAGTENPADFPTKLVSVDETRVKLRGIGAVFHVR